MDFQVVDVEFIKVISHILIPAIDVTHLLTKFP